MRTKTYSLIAATLLSAASLAVAAAPVAVACPSDFHKLTVPSDAKQCQQFDATLPATLVFYSSTPQQSLIDHFQASYPGMAVVASVQGRTLLTANNDTVRVIISPDNKGSQGDMMGLGEQE